MARAKSSPARDSTAHLGFEAKLWLAADKLRNNMDAAEYKHVVLGLIFLKYISDTFEEHRAKLLAGEGDYAGANPEDPDEYKAENVFWVPADARWSHLQANAKQSTIGKTVDDAMVAIERDNPRLKGVLPKDYARPGLDKHRLGQLIDLIGGIDLIERAPSPQPSPSGRIDRYGVRPSNVVNLTFMRPRSLPGRFIKNSILRGLGREGFRNGRGASSQEPIKNNITRPDPIDRSTPLIDRRSARLSVEETRYDAASNLTDSAKNKSTQLRDTILGLRIIPWPEPTGATPS